MITHALGYQTKLPPKAIRETDLYAELKLTEIFLRPSRTGIWYDPQDLTTLFQDAAGTLPVYRPGTGLVDPPVGLMLDKSGGGYHASQTTTPNRPPLSGRYNLLTATEDFTSINWAKNIRTSTTANIITCTITSGAEVCVSQTTGTFPGGTPLKLSVVAKAVGSGAFLYLRLIAIDSGFPSGVVTFDLSNGTIVFVGASYTGACSIEPVGNGYFRCSIEGVVSAAPPVYRVDIGCTSSNSGGVGAIAGYAVEVVSSDLRVKRDGSSLPAYQSVTNANTYDTIGFPLFLRRDKVDDDLIVQAPAITGQTAWGSINTVDIAAATIAAGEYKPFGTITAGEPTCTQWIAIDGTLTAAEQAILERYVYSKSKLPVGA